MLEAELRHFEAIKEELLGHHDGKFALIIGSELIGIFDSQAQAYETGVRSRGNVPMLIKKIARDEGVESIPVLTLGLLHAHI